MVTVYCSPNRCRCGKHDCPKNFDNAPRGFAVTTTNLSRECDDFFPVFTITDASISDAMHRLADTAASAQVEYPECGYGTEFLKHVRFSNLTAYDVVRIYNSIKKENNV